MRGPSQRRGFIRREWNPQEVYGELDYLHQILNDYDPPRQIFQDYGVTVYDSRISCMKPNLALQLPSLREEDDGWPIFIQDRSGTASFTTTISAPAGLLIHRTSASAQTVNLTGAYQKITLQWDFKNNAYYEI